MTPNRSDLRQIVDSVRAGIEAELRVAGRGIPFSNLGVDSTSGVLTFVLESDSSTLDESMEDGSLKWIGQPEGKADIISVVPEFSHVHAILTGGTMPRPNQTIWVNPPRFLEPLLQFWRKDNRAEQAAAFRFSLTENGFDADLVPPNEKYPLLREWQRRAFELLGYRRAFLWGPPGTGKTFTLGCMIASYLLHRPADRILLVSSTNVAVDQAISAVDDALKSVRAVELRKLCFRFGSRFDPRRFEHREHLIPVRDQQLISAYRNHMVSVPDPRDPQKYAAWKDKLEVLREKIRRENRQFLASARLAAMTATYAVFQDEDLQTCAPYDLVIFDEASQAGLAHAMMLASLGKHVLFAGDHKQLSPIVQASKDEHSQRWIGRSPFEYMNLTGTVKTVLQEQSRMAPDICRVISNLFYEQKLRVAAKESADPVWQAQRKVDCGPYLGSESVTLLSAPWQAEPVRGSGRGYFCRESADLVVAIAARIAQRVNAADISILTPYRAQRAEISNRLDAERLSRSLVSTVHRAQGSERLVVIVDPVRPSSDFVNSEEGNRLLNVAFSRAKGRLFVLLHPDYQYHAKLRELAAMFPIRSVAADEVRPVQPFRARQMPITVQTRKPRLVPQPKQQSPNLADQFREELYAGLIGRNSRADRRWFTVELASKFKYKKLEWATRDHIIAEVNKQLPQVND
jgi:hypothetical protein